MARATLVIQSHRTPLPAPWYERCLDSVRSWAAEAGFSYRYLGDELFEPLTPVLLAKLAGRSMVAADLGRLLALERGLDDGYQRVVWIDADVLMLPGTRLRLPDAGAAFGREVWVQQQEGRGLRVHTKIHNAVMMFAAGDPVLPFYRYAAERILRRHAGPPVPQLIGPKLLSLLHNAIQFEVIEQAGMLSPAVAVDLLEGGSGDALELFVENSAELPSALNLCGSMVGGDGLGNDQMALLVGLLQGNARIFG